MTRDEAVSILRRYRRSAFRFQEKYVIFPKRNALFRECVYGKILVDEIIRQIRESDDDPIRIVSRLYSKLDFILGDSDDDHFETHAFAALMEYLTGDILRYLQKIEKEKNEDAEN